MAFVKGRVYSKNKGTLGERCPVFKKKEENP